jgi:formate/nitrite transporter FocA (FNT family)
LLPAEVAVKAEEVGAAKARLDTLSLLVLAVLAGAFVAFGVLFAINTVAVTTGAWPWGVVRLLSGLVFSLGLILVVGGVMVCPGSRGIRRRAAARP